MAAKVKRKLTRRRSAKTATRAVSYRGIKIKPLMAGKRSPLAKAIRDELCKSGRSRGEA
jgi:hypothetical protein